MKRKRNKGLVSFAKESANLIKTFASLAKNDEEAQQEFADQLSDISEEDQETILSLFERSSAEMNKTRRSEKSSSKGNAQVDGTAQVMTKKEKAMEMLSQGKDKSTIMKDLACDRKTVDRARKAMEAA